MDKLFSYTAFSTGNVYLWDLAEVEECFVFEVVERLESLEVGETFETDGGGLWERVE